MLPELTGLLRNYTLNDRRLIQINSGCAVNADWIESYTKDTVVMKNGKSLSVSRDRAKKVKLQIRENWGRSNEKNTKTYENDTFLFWDGKIWYNR